MDREHSFITIRLRTDKQLLGTNQTLISRKMQEQDKQQNQTGHVYVRITIDTGVAGNGILTVEERRAILKCPIPLATKGETFTKFYKGVHRM